VDTTRTDHSLNNPSHPTPRARDLRERLDSAADEGLSQNIARFLRFLGHKDGDAIELQALGVPGKYGPIHQFTHVSSLEDAIGALELRTASRRTGEGQIVFVDVVRRVEFGGGRGLMLPKVSTAVG
jgi:hypothetical protein